MMVFYIYGFSAYVNFLNHGVNVGVHSGIPRLRSTFNEPSQIALFLIPIYPLIIYSKNKLAIVLAAIAFFLTLSTSAFVGLVVAIIIMSPIVIIRIKPSVIKRVLIVILLLIPVIYYIYPSLTSVMGKGIHIQQYDSTRYNAWITSLQLFVDSPIWGHGIASYYSFAPRGVFSWYIQILLETGILGMVGLSAFFIPIFRMVWKKGDKTILFFIIAYLMQMVSMNHYYIPGIWVLIGFIYAKDIEQSKKQISSV